MNQERLMQVLLAPQISEKATFMADKNEQVIFRVVSDATKPEVKGAVELLFKVSVESVQIANVKGKQKKFGRSHGQPQELEEGLCLPEARSGDQFRRWRGC
jgi:large subunit ribosomal protein L23